MKLSKSLAKQIVECFKRDNKIICFGNGGSLSDAAHFCGEFNGIGTAMALNDPVKITSIANDFDPSAIFSLQINDMGKKGDIAIGISSSGRSANVNYALNKAKDMELIAIDWPRKGNNTQEVQQYQYKLLHSVYLEVKKQLK